MTTVHDLVHPAHEHYFSILSEVVRISHNIERNEQVSIYDDNTVLNIEMTTALKRYPELTGSGRLPKGCTEIICALEHWPKSGYLKSKYQLRHGEHTIPEIVHCLGFSLMWTNPVFLSKTKMGMIVELKRRISHLANALAPSYLEYGKAIIKAYGIGEEEEAAMHWQEITRTAARCTKIARDFGKLQDNNLCNPHSPLRNGRS